MSREIATTSADTEKIPPKGVPAPIPVSGEDPAATHDTKEKSTEGGGGRKANTDKSFEKRDRKREAERKRFCSRFPEAELFFHILEERVRNTELKMLSAQTLDELYSEDIVEKTEQNPESKKMRRTFVSAESLARYFDEKPKNMQVWMNSEIEHADRLLRAVWIEAVERLRVTESIIKNWFEEQEQSIAERIGAADYPDLGKIGRVVANKPGTRVFFEKKAINELKSQVSGQEKAIEIQKRKSNDRLLALWEKREAAVGKEWATQVVEEITSHIAEKLKWAKETFENTEGKYTRKQYDDLIGFLESSQNSAKRALVDGRYVRLGHILNEVKNAGFIENENVLDSDSEIPDSDTGDGTGSEAAMSQEFVSILGFEVSAGTILIDTQQGGSRYRVDSVEGSQVSCTLLNKNPNYQGKLIFDRSDPAHANRFVLDDRSQSDDLIEEQQALSEDDPSNKSLVEILEEEFPKCEVDVEMFLNTLIESASTFLEQLQAGVQTRTLSVSLQREIVSEYLRESLQEIGGIDDEAQKRVIEELFQRIMKDVV